LDPFLKERIWFKYIQIFTHFLHENYLFGDIEMQRNSKMYLALSHINFGTKISRNFANFPNFWGYKILPTKFYQVMKFLIYLYCRTDPFCEVILPVRGDNFSPRMPCQWYRRGGGEGKRRILICQSVLPPPPFGMAFGRLKLSPQDYTVLYSADIVIFVPFLGGGEGGGRKRTTQYTYNPGGTKQKSYMYTILGITLYRL
jgi:hypothetical protein